MIHNSEFEMQFGHVGHFMTGGLVYERNDSDALYHFPEERADEINDLMKKSLHDNHDYILDIVKNNEFILDPEVVY